MKAMIAEKAGGAEVLRLAEVEKPDPGPGELLVKTAACALNPVDYKIRSGYLSQQRTYPAIYGYDVCGVVVEAAEGVAHFKPGDEVFYFADLSRQGAYAEYHVVRQEIVAKKPANLSCVEAAALPLAGSTAWQALFEQIGLKMGETVLVYGAAGGVGSLAVQMAAWAGARVLGVCSEGNVGYVENLGADHVIDYEGIDVAEAVMELTGGHGVDAAFDTVGGVGFDNCLGLLKPFGRMAFLNAFPAGEKRTLAALNPARLKNAAVHFTLVRNKRSHMEALAVLAWRGFLKPQVEDVIPLAKIPDGHRRLETMRGRGKIVVDMKAG
ncbi:MAG: quinone oxidoreductase family protein [Candidatus Nitrospinota bacterium M3_3B_026]